MFAEIQFFTDHKYGSWKSHEGYTKANKHRRIQRKEQHMEDS